MKFVAFLLFCAYVTSLPSSDTFDEFATVQRPTPSPLETESDIQLPETMKPTPEELLAAIEETNDADYAEALQDYAIYRKAIRLQEEGHLDAIQTGYGRKGKSGGRCGLFCRIRKKAMKKILEKFVVPQLQMISAKIGDKKFSCDWLYGVIENKIENGQKTPGWLKVTFKIVKKFFKKLFVNSICNPLVKMVCAKAEELGKKYIPQEAKAAYNDLVKKMCPSSGAGAGSALVELVDTVDSWTE